MNITLQKMFDEARALNMSTDQFENEGAVEVSPEYAAFAKVQNENVKKFTEYSNNSFLLMQKNSNLFGDETETGPELLEWFITTIECMGSKRLPDEMLEYCVTNPTIIVMFLNSFLVGIGMGMEMQKSIVTPD